jgi:hypothetical protein
LEIEAIELGIEESVTTAVSTLIVLWGGRKYFASRSHCAEKNSFLSGMLQWMGGSRKKVQAVSIWNPRFLLAD